MRKKSPRQAEGQYTTKKQVSWENYVLLLPGTVSSSGER